MFGAIVRSKRFARSKASCISANLNSSTWVAIMDICKIVMRYVYDWGSNMNRKCCPEMIVQNNSRNFRGCRPNRVGIEQLSVCRIHSEWAEWLYGAGQRDLHAVELLYTLFVWLEYPFPLIFGFCEYIYMQTCSIDIKPKTVTVTEKSVLLSAMFDVLRTKHCNFHCASWRASHGAFNQNPPLTQSTLSISSRWEQIWHILLHGNRYMCEEPESLHCLDISYINLKKGMWLHLYDYADYTGVYLFILSSGVCVCVKIQRPMGSNLPSCGRCRGTRAWRDSEKATPFALESGMVWCCKQDAYLHPAAEPPTSHSTSDSPRHTAPHLNTCISEVVKQRIAQPRSDIVHAPIFKWQPICDVAKKNRVIYFTANLTKQIRKFMWISNSWKN